MLHIVKSVTQYLRETTEIDLSRMLAHYPDVAKAGDSTLVYSSITAGGEPAWLLDSATGQFVSTVEGDSPCFIGVTWPESRPIDAIRVHWPTGETPVSVVKLQTWDGSVWTDAGATTFALAEGWNLLRLPIARYASGVRLAYVSGRSASRLFASELEVYEDMRLEPRPSLWPPNERVFVAFDEREIDGKTLPLVTLYKGELDREAMGQGMSGVDDQGVVVVQLYARSEDELEVLRRWTCAVLDLAIATTREGLVVWGGVPVKAVNYPLSLISGGEWWSSQQRGWFASPAPVVRVGNVVTAPTQTDYVRGRVELDGVSASADVRADFTCDVWTFLLEEPVYLAPQSHGDALTRHSCQIALRGAAQSRSYLDAVA